MTLRCCRRLTPKPTGEPLHLYGIDHAGDVGFATRLQAESGHPLRAFHETFALVGIIIRDPKTFETIGKPNAG